MAADGLKQRLVGGATLLMVAVFAWFWLLSADSPIDPVARESQIPTAPDIQPFAAQEPVAPQGIEPIGSERDSKPALESDVVPKPAPAPTQANNQRTDIQAAAVPKPQPLKTPQSAAVARNSEPPATLKTAPKVALKTAKDSKLVPETFQLDQHGLPVAWVVQVGLFSTQAHADKIKATLQASGFKAYTEPFKSDKSSGVKVFVGPKLSRERADAQKKAIDQLLKTNTMVVRFATS